MKVLFDSQIFDVQKYGGISRYFVELFKFFNTNKDIDYYLPIRNSFNEYLKNTSPFNNKKLTSHPISNFKGKFLIYKLLDVFDKGSNMNLVKNELKKQNFDIFHPTYYNNYFLKYIGKKKFVLTVYDMIHEIYPHYFVLDRGRTSKLKKQLINRADKIIAISESTKNDIINLYNIDDKKIEVVYLANSLKSYNLDSTSNHVKLPTKYILFVGSRGLYKNFDFFVKSISNLLKDDVDLFLVTVGGGQFSKKEKKYLESLDIYKKVIQMSLNDNDLSFVYKKALCFVFPSLYEGFGLPVLEAFACECPTVLSNTSSLPEVGGNASVYFDPSNTESILENVKKVVVDDDLRKNMIALGKKQLKKFSWEKTSKETIDIYKSLL